MPSVVEIERSAGACSSIATHRIGCILMKQVNIIGWLTIFWLMSFFMKKNRGPQPFFDRPGEIIPSIQPKMKTV